MLILILLPLFFFTVFSAVFITPAYPPTAYQNQFYSIVFRIRGIDFPTYKITGLPMGLVGCSNGTIIGIPASYGSYSVKLTYITDTQMGSKDFILKVAQDAINRKNQTNTSIQKSKQMTISYPNNLIFRVKQKITFKFNLVQGAQPLLWSFINLPEGLTSNTKTGLLQGSIQKQGYYTLNVQVADRYGISTSAHITINIQPLKSSDFSQSIVFQLQQSVDNKIIDVESQDVSDSINLESIQNEYIEANNEVNKMKDIADDQYKIVNAIKKIVDLRNQKTQNLNQTFIEADAQFNDTNEKFKLASTKLAVLSNSLNVAQRKLELVLVQQTSSQENNKFTINILNTAQSRFQKAQLGIQQAQKEYVQSKKQYSTNQSQLRDLNTIKAADLQEYKRSASGLQASKKVQQDSRIRKQISDLSVKSSQDSLEITIQARDNAQNNMKQAIFYLNQSQNKLNALLDKLSSIRGKYVQIKQQLNAEKWDYQLALNKLYIAQARKQTADRASAIALAEGSSNNQNVDFKTYKRSLKESNSLPQEIFKTNSTNNFNKSDSIVVPSASSLFLGCQSASYPPIVGTVQIKQILKAGYTLASGHQIIFGDCTEMKSFQQIKLGDWVQFYGYLAGNIVNALKIQRVLKN